jgi:Uma2 family endonuclease
MASHSHAATEADLLRMPKDGRKYELVDGQIRVSPAGARHGAVCLLLGARLLTFVRKRKLGHVFDSSTGFRLPSGSVRSPDVAFVATGRFENDRPTEGFSPIAPDLAVEVLSPEDRSQEVLEKVGEYLDCGVRLVWVVDPATRVTSCYRSLTDVRILSADGEFDGEDVLPGFRCPVADVLA